MFQYYLEKSTHISSAYTIIKASVVHCMINIGLRGVENVCTKLFLIITFSYNTS